MADDHGQRIMTAAVYLLWCGPRRHLYCGWTTDVERRLAAHRAGKGARYTSRYAAIDLAAVLPMPDASAARREEARIKRLSRAEKLELVRALGPEPARALSPGTRTPAA